jgi:UDP-2,3-diacylglucosamine pyrophosphatase LpxH
MRMTETAGFRQKTLTSMPHSARGNQEGKHMTVTSIRTDTATSPAKKTESRKPQPVERRARKRSPATAPQYRRAGDRRAPIIRSDAPFPRNDQLRFRSIWISDVHFGTRACKADFLLDFLERTRCERLYLVGDMIDFWNLKSGWYWPATHSKALQKIMEKAAGGVEVIYVPGNHDELFRDYSGSMFAGIKVAPQIIHEAADGRRFLVIHGDEFDSIVKHSKWLAVLGSGMYDFLLYANRWVNFVRRRLGFTSNTRSKTPSITSATSNRPWRTRPGVIAWTALSAGTFTRPRSSTSAMFCTSTTATGSSPVPPWSSATTGRSPYCTGPTSAAGCSRRAVHRGGLPPSEKRHEDRGRDRCVASTGQRRG